MKPIADPTPAWNRIRATHPDAHEELVALATSILECGAERVVLSQIDGAVVAAKGLGLLKIEDDAVLFGDTVLRDEYMSRLIYSNRDDDWASPDAFARAIAEAQHRTVHLADYKAICCKLVVILVGAGVDVLGHVRALASRGKDSNHALWSVYPVLCDALPSLEISPEQLTEAILPVLAATAGDLTNGMVYEAVGRWAAASRQRADDFVDHVRSRAIAEFVPVALLAVSTFDPVSAHAAALEIAEGNDPVMASAAVVALGNLAYQEDGDSRLKATLELFARFSEKSDTSHEAPLVQATFQLLKAGVPVAESLVRLSSSHDSRTQYAVAAGLFACAESAVDADWWRTALFNLAGVDRLDRGTFRYLDYSASRLIKSEPVVALQFVESVVMATEGDHLPTEVHELLSSTSAELHEHAVQQLEDAITDWFASDDHRLHRLAASFVHVHAQSRDGDPSYCLVLGPERLAVLADREIVNVAQRIAGWVYGGHALSALMLSSLRTPKTSQLVVASVHRLLVDVVLYNYPGGAGDHLRKRLGDQATLENETALIVATLAESDAYYDSLRALPELPELRIPTQRAYLRHLDDVRDHAGIVEQAHKQSVLMSLVHNIPLKYGRAFFSDHAGVLTPPTELTSFSHSVELPRGEKIDPVGQLVLRMNLRAALAIEGARKAENVR